MWFFPHHEEIMGSSQETDYLVYSGSGFIYPDGKQS
jgi:hypothetical protein